MLSNRRIWDTATGQCLRTLVHEDNPPVTSVCFSPNGRFVLAHSMDSCLRLWDYVSGTVKKTYQGHVNKGFSIGGCFGTIDGEAFIASASEDGGIVMWDVKSKQIVQRIEGGGRRSGGGHEGVCFWVDVNGDTLVSAGQDGKIRVYRHRRRIEPTAAPQANGVNGGDHTSQETGTPNGVAGKGDEIPVTAEDRDTEMRDALLGDTDVKVEQV